MVAEAKTAYSRICNDPDADKFEYPAYIRKQEVETRRAYAECIAGNNTDLAPLIMLNICILIQLNLIKKRFFKWQKISLNH